MGQDLDSVKADIASAKIWAIGHIWTVGAVIVALLFFKII